MLYWKWGCSIANGKSGQYFLKIKKLSEMWSYLQEWYKISLINSTKQRHFILLILSHVNQNLVDSPFKINVIKKVGKNYVKKIKQYSVSHPASM